VWNRTLRPCTWLATLVLLTGCALPTSNGEVDHGSPEPWAVASPDDPAPGGPAARQLTRLEVKGRAPMTGYDRAQFGAAWLDTDRNGCDTRNDMLTRDLEHRSYDPRTRGCVVLSGVLDDPFTGRSIEFRKGDGNLVDVDHVVALGNAWATGAFRWEIRKRAAFANDPMNLLAVDASANRQKGDGDAATWLPGNKSFRCEYVARQVGVKSKYGLWVTPAEKDATARVLASCPGQPRVRDSGAPVLAPLSLSESDAFASCAEARAAGAAPLRRGDPGYSLSLDGDRDGIACE
jgi:hypothetical protein